MCLFEYSFLMHALAYLRIPLTDWGLGSDDCSDVYIGEHPKRPPSATGTAHRYHRCGVAEWMMKMPRKEVSVSSMMMSYYRMW